MARHLPLLALLVLVAAIFGRALSGAYVYDDLTLIVGNPAIAAGDWWQVLAQPLWGVAFPHWRPLTQILLAVGHGTAGAAAIHALALMLHLLAVAVAHRLVRRLTGDARAAFCAALLFALHPAQVESVAWCAALNDVLWGVCALLALDAHVAAHGRGQAGVSWRVVAWFALGLLAKETALVIPLLLLAVDLLRPDNAGGPRRWTSYLRLALVLLPWLGARMLVFADWRAGFDRGPVLDVSSREAGRLVFELAGRLLSVLVWPVEQKAMRPMPVEFTTSGYGFVALTVAAISLLVFARARGAWRVALAMVIVLIPLAPPVWRPGSAGEYLIADRYLYVSVLGLALALTSLLRWRRVGVCVLLLVAVLFGVRASIAVGAWSSPLAFAQAQLGDGDPARADARVLYMLGQLDLEAQPPRAQAADVWLRRAANRVGERRFGGEDGRVRLQADIGAGLAWCAFFAESASVRPDWRRPAAMFEQILQQHEVHAPAHVGLAVCLASLGLRDAAERHLLRALELEPNLAAARHNLALLRQR